MLTFMDVQDIQRCRCKQPHKEDSQVSRVLLSRSWLYCGFRRPLAASSHSLHYLLWWFKWMTWSHYNHKGGGETDLCATRAVTALWRHLYPTKPYGRIKNISGLVCKKMRANFLLKTIDNWFEGSFEHEFWYFYPFGRDSLKNLK